MGNISVEGGDRVGAGYNLCEGIAIVTETEGQGEYVTPCVIFCIGEDARTGGEAVRRVVGDGRHGVAVGLQGCGHGIGFEGDGLRVAVHHNFREAGALLGRCDAGAAVRSTVLHVDGDAGHLRAAVRAAGGHRVGGGSGRRHGDGAGAGTGAPVVGGVGGVAAVARHDGIPAVVGHTSVGGKLYGDGVAGRGEACASHRAQQSVVQLCASGTGAIINGDVVAAALAIGRYEGDGERVAIAGGEGVYVAFTVAVASARAA